MNKRIPVTIVTGFLGSGKTTVLRHLLNYSNLRLAVMINEFGDVGLDGDLVKNCNFCSEDEQANRIVELTNGCLCCTVQEDFLPSMEVLLERSSELDGIIIETSGLAFPKPLIQAIQWPQIRRKIFVNGVVTLVDGQALSKGSPVGDITSLEKQRQDDPNIDHLTPIDELFKDQLSVADLVLLSRSDVISNNSIDSIKNSFSSKIREGTMVIPISHGQVDPSIVLGLRDPEDLLFNNIDNNHSDNNDDHSHQHLNIISSSIRYEGLVNQQQLQEYLLEICSQFQILRLKGRIWINGKSIPLQIQMVGPRLNSWYEPASNQAWKPRTSGLELVVLSLKDGPTDSIDQWLNARTNNF